MSAVARRGQDALALGAIAAVALAYVGGHLWLQAPVGGGNASADIYAAQYPMFIYAWRSLVQGEGYLWNGLQNCGQPLIPMTPPGMLYPPNLLFLVFGLPAGFPALGVIHLFVGGAATYALCREYGAQRLAALCGAFAFTLSGSAVQLTTWLPTANLGAFIWLPVAMLMLERLLERPAAAPALGLGAALGLQLLAGCPQVAWFTHQVIALRLVWAFVSRQVFLPGRLLMLFGLAVALCLGLAAVQLLPSLEFTRASLRSLQLSIAEIEPNGVATWPVARAQLFPALFVRPFALAAVALAVTAWASRRARSMVLFYWAIAVIYVLLLFDSPLFRLYLDLPFGKAFRYQLRFIYVVSFAVSVLVGLGAQAVVGVERQGGWARRCLPVSGLWLGGAVYCWLATVAPAPAEWGLFAVLTLAAVAAMAQPRWSTPAALLIAGSLLANLWLCDLAPFLGFQRNGRELLMHRAAAFDAVRTMMTPQDRMFQYDKGGSFSIMAKSASVFGLPSIFDYEPQTARRYAEMVVFLTHDAELRNSNDFIWSSVSQQLTNRPLMNLLATRYVVSGPDGTPVEDWLQPPYQLRWTGDGVRVFENPDALPRAYWVPRLAVVPTPSALLRRLASPGHRPREVALVEELPADGYLGEQTMPPPLGEVVSLQDHGETVRLDVAATHAGFVVLTDQFFTGWQATVNGVATPILRANYAFRAVRVPPGASVVEFHYRPHSVWVGLAISVSSAAGMLLYAAWSWRAARLRKRRACLDF